MSSHRDFTPDEDQDELLLSAPRPPESPDTRTPLSPAVDAQPQPPVTAIRLKVNNAPPSRKSSSSTSSSAHRAARDGGGDIDAELLDEGVPSPTMEASVVSLGKVAQKPASAGDQYVRPFSGVARKRVLSNPTEPPGDDGAPSDRKRVKVASITGKKGKRTSKSGQSMEQGRPPSPSLFTGDGDDLLADELELMDEEVAKQRSTRGSSRDLTPYHGFTHPQNREMDTLVPPLEEQQEPAARGRQTASSSPEITLLEGKTPHHQGIVVPIPAPPPRVGVPLKRKKKTWLQQGKTVPIAIAPNPGLGAGTPEPITVDKRKPARKSRAIKTAAAAAVVASSPHVEPMDGEGYSVPPEMFLGGEAIPSRGELGMSVDGVSDVGSDVKPKKKKSKKLKPGEVGPGKHWRKGLFGPHSARQLNADGTEMGGESPRSNGAGSSTGGRLILPKPTGGSLRRAPSGMKSRNLHSNNGDNSDHAITPDYDELYDDDDDGGGGASNRSSPEILMRNDPTIALTRPQMAMQTCGSQSAVQGASSRPKPLLEGAQGQYIVPRLPAQVNELGHPVYQNSILTRGISIIRIQDFSGAKAKERELMVPRALKDNLGPRARQFAEGYRVITGVGGAKLKFRSWIPRTATSEYRVERDAKIEEIRARDAALSSGMHTETPARPGLFSSASQRLLAAEGMTPESWVMNQNQIHLGQQVRKISAYAQSVDAGVTPPKKPVKKKKKKKVIKSAAELVPDVSEHFDSVVPSAVASPDVSVVNDPMDAVPSTSQFNKELSPTYVDDLIMETV